METKRAIKSYDKKNKGKKQQLDEFPGNLVGWELDY